MVTEAELDAKARELIELLEYIIEHIVPEDDPAWMPISQIEPNRVRNRRITTP